MRIISPTVDAYVSLIRFEDLGRARKEVTIPVADYLRNCVRHKFDDARLLCDVTNYRIFKAWKHLTDESGQSSLTRLEGVVYGGLGKDGTDSLQQEFGSETHFDRKLEHTAQQLLIGGDDDSLTQSQVTRGRLYLLKREAKKADPGFTL